MPPSLLRVLLALFACLSPSAAAAAPPACVEFNRDVRPILADTCFPCHGPDAARRKADLRLDVEAEALKDRGGRHAVVPGAPGRSELFRRVTATGRERMPPARTGRTLMPGQIGVLRRWIAEGARWQRHWSWIPPTRPPLPAVRERSWVRNPIDTFVLARLEREGLTPSPEADRTTLIRRVTLDLTGLPPTPAEVDAFLADSSRGAYARVVDRLLRSPRHGERMAFPWLEAARYADTNGYQSDGERSMWRWRDWVIDAFNSNMPFDRFAVEQLAGDLLPQPTLEERIATGFNRNHRGNAEGGIIPEEYAVEYVVDRVDTTATVFLGLTMGCARCHDHKFDPIRQREYYRVFAFFNNVPERGKAVKYGNSPPMILAPTPAQREQLRLLGRELAAAAARCRQLEPELAQAQATWEASLLRPAGSETRVARPESSKGVPVGAACRAGPGERPFRQKPGPFRQKGPTGTPFEDSGRATQGAALATREPTGTHGAAPGWTVTGGLAAHYPLDGDARDRTGRHPDGRFRDGAPAYVAGRTGRAAVFDGRRSLEAADVGEFGYLDKFTLSAWIQPRTARGVIVSRTADVEQGEGYSAALERGKVQVNLVKRWLDDAIRVETDECLSPGRWYHIAVTYDGSRVARGIRVYVNGRPAALRVNLDDLNQDFKSREPFRVGAGGGPANRFDGVIGDVRIYTRVLSAQEAGIVATPESVADIVRLPADRRTPGQAAKVRACFLEQFAPPAVRRAHRRLVDLARRRERFIEGLPTTMVMEEMARPRDTFVLLRGQYDRPGERVTPGIPASLGALPRGGPVSRLAFARWLVDRANPLTARVAVNRYWQIYFGTGLVKTAEDFGTQGEWPSHPELLDWLAAEFMSPSPRGGEGPGVRGWNVKALQRLIVTSATYRQSSRLTPTLRQRDPENRLLARGPRFRLSAEMIRDQALAASGLLAERLGGPSVKPYQPARLWDELADTAYVQSHGPDLYCRSLYTFWKRTVAPPSLLTFDAAGRETCVVRPTRTNTPLQALNLLNDVTYVEAARVLAERVMREARTPEERLTVAFRLAAARRPRAVELKVLVEGFRTHLAEYRRHPEAARRLVRAGEFRQPEDLDRTELAAYTAVASLILNLDETLTKE
jgi:hypothetical protein